MNSNPTVIRMVRGGLQVLVGSALTMCAFAAETFSLVVPAATPVASDAFHPGTATRPDGTTLTVDPRSLLRNGRRWTPVMGEFHFTRSPAANWRDELLKMKAGGLDIVATYVFWIHHEEIEGEWDWTERRHLREFVRLAGEVGLDVVVRCGPWCHGEVRNGGLPDWTLHRTDWRARTQEPGFLAHVRTLYAQIAQQLAGQLWKDGGPVIGIQVDNEYGGPAEYLLALKAIAREVGLDVPLYTRTGWPALTTPMPFGEILPLYGAYAEGFWDRETTAMPGRYWTAFRFSELRLDENIANEQLGRQLPHDEADVARYPYLTCEMGGGMMSSYHRRIRLDPADIEVPVLIKLGSGSTLPGYYMYHGGTNPEGKRTTLHEAQATAATNWNDLPVKNYDFQAPLGAAGQIRESYHVQRRLHLFLHDFGEKLAAMPPVLPEVTPQGRDDTSTLRWIVRSDGDSGFLFVSNYERGRVLPAHADVTFNVELPGPDVSIGTGAVASGARFIWPFNLDLGHGVRLGMATAQPLCYIDHGDTRTVFFEETEGTAPAFWTTVSDGDLRVFMKQGLVHGPSDGSVRIVTLPQDRARMLWKAKWRGRDRVFRTPANLTIDGDTIRLTAENPADLLLDVYPGSTPDAGGDDVAFERVPVPAVATVEIPAVAFNETRAAGPLRTINLGAAAKPVAEQPGDAGFADAAEWSLKLPADLDLSVDPILRIRYVGDVARVSVDGRLLVDDFYNGLPLELRVRDHAPAILRGDLRIAVLPLQHAAVTGDDPLIYLSDDVQPDFGGAASCVNLKSVELIPRYRVEIKPE